MDMFPQDYGFNFIADYLGLLSHYPAIHTDPILNRYYEMMINRLDELLELPDGKICNGCTVVLSLVDDIA